MVCPQHKGEDPLGFPQSLPWRYWLRGYRDCGILGGILAAYGAATFWGDDNAPQAGSRGGGPWHAFGSFRRETKGTPGVGRVGPLEGAEAKFSSLPRGPQAPLQRSPRPRRWAKTSSFQKEKQRKILRWCGYLCYNRICMQGSCKKEAVFAWKRERP